MEILFWRVIVFLLAFFFFSIFLFLLGLKFRLNSQHVQVYDDIWMLIILYPIDFRIIFSKFLLQPGPPKCSFLATPLCVPILLYVLLKWHLFVDIAGSTFFQCKPRQHLLYKEVSHGPANPPIQELGNLARVWTLNPAPTAIIWRIK